MLALAFVTGFGVDGFLEPALPETSDGWTTATSKDGTALSWVFAAGRYKISCDDVPKIIEDNGYTEVYSPEAGDVVVL